MAIPMLQTEALSVLRQDRNILADVNATFPANKLSILIGPNGAGKTTLLRTLAGLQKPSSGRVLIGDAQSLDQLAISARALLLAWIPNAETQPFDYTVRDVVMLGRFPWHQGVPRALDHQRTEDALARLGVAAFASRTFNSLSSGERQKVQVARVLAGDAAVILLDEPCANLDIKASLELLELLRTECAQARTIVMSLHDIDLARRFGEHLLCLASGELVQEGSTAAVLTPALIARVFGVRASVARTDSGLESLRLEL